MTATRGGPRWKGVNPVWNDERRAVLALGYDTQRAADLAAALGVTTGAVCTQARKMGLRKQRPRVWTPERRAIIARDYRARGATALAAEFNCTPLQIRSIAYQLGVTRRQRKIITYRWTVERLQVLLDFYGVIPSAELAKRLGCSVESIYGKAKDIGLKRGENSARVLVKHLHIARKLRVLLAVSRGMLTPEEAAPMLGCRPADVPGLLAREAAVGARGEG